MSGRVMGVNRGHMVKHLSFSIHFSRDNKCCEKYKDLCVLVWHIFLLLTVDML